MHGPNTSTTCSAVLCSTAAFENAHAVHAYVSAWRWQLTAAEMPRPTANRIDAHLIVITTIALCAVATIATLSALVNGWSRFPRFAYPRQLLWWPMNAASSSPSLGSLASATNLCTSNSWHELQLDANNALDTASNEVTPGVFPHSVINYGCPRFVHIEYHEYAGIGHRLSNLAMAMIAARVLNATLMYDSLDYYSIKHGNFTGADAFFGLRRGEHSSSEIVASYPNLTLVALPRMDGYRSWEAGGPFSPNDAPYIVWGGYASSRRAQCWVRFVVPRDDWVRDPKPLVKTIFAKKWTRNEAALQRALSVSHGERWTVMREDGLVLSDAEVEQQRGWRTPIWSDMCSISATSSTASRRWSVRYAPPVLAPSHIDIPPPRTLIVAVHLRVGDINPTPPAWIAAVLSQSIIRPLATLAPSVALDIHVFCQDDIGKARLLPIRALATPPSSSSSLTARPVVNVTFHFDTPALTVFWHCTVADVFVQSRSAFSEYAALVSTRPLSFAPQGSRFVVPPSKNISSNNKSSSSVSSSNGGSGGGVGGVASVPNWAYWQCGVRNVCCDPGEGAACPSDTPHRIANLLRRRGWLEREPTMDALGAGGVAAAAAAADA